MDEEKIKERMRKLHAEGRAEAIEAESHAIMRAWIWATPGITLGEIEALRNAAGVAAQALVRRAGGE